MRFTTVNTDAGVKEGKAAVAYWIRSNSVWVTGSQELKQADLCSNKAELSAIIIGLNKVINNEYLRTADLIVVNSDSKTALGWMKGGDCPSFYKPYLDAIYKVIPKNKIRFKWIKGHSKNTKSRNWVNNWCDRQVRKHYKGEVAKFRSDIL